jgi:hypothetical protein
MVKIEPPSCRQYNPGNFHAVRPLNWDEIINGDVDVENWADARAQSGGRSLPSDCSDNDDGEGQKDKPFGDIEAGTENGTHSGKGRAKGKATKKGKGKGKTHGKGKGIVKHTPGGEDISHGVALQLQI